MNCGLKRLLLLVFDVFDLAQWQRASLEELDVAGSIPAVIVNYSPRSLG